MTFIKAIGRILLTILKYILLIIGLVIFPIMSWAVMGSIQSLIFVQDDFIMWTVGDSVPIIALFLFSILCSYFFIIKKATKQNNEFANISRFVRKHRKSVIAIFIGILMIIGYYMITNLSVISSDKIVTHSFFYPKGKEYSYSNIKSIHTGAYNRTIPYMRSKGEFYYIIELDNGKKINIANVGGIKDNEDSWLTIMKLDEIFTKFADTKNVDAKHFDKYHESLGKIYRDRVINVFENIK